MASQSRAISTTKAVGFVDHDHRACVRRGLRAAEKHCKDEGLRLTPVRRKVLELLLREHRALGAYAILDLLGKAGFPPQPPVAYRALHFLQEHGFVHRIERLNAFVACAHPGERHMPVFLVCRMCDAVAEASVAQDRGSLGVAARAAGFEVTRAIVEVEGVCSTCQENAPA